VAIHSVDIRTNAWLTLRDLQLMTADVSGKNNAERSAWSRGIAQTMPKMCYVDVIDVSRTLASLSHSVS